MFNAQTDSPRKGGPIKTTFLGGLLFLLPIVLIVFLLGKAIGIAQRLSQPMVQAAGVDSVAGVATGTIIAIFCLVALSFPAGLVARTGSDSRPSRGWKTASSPSFPSGE